MCVQGSVLFQDRLAAEDDPVVRLLEARGAIIVGKTNTPEFGAGSQTYNRWVHARHAPLCLKQGVWAHLSGRGFGGHSVRVRGVGGGGGGVRGTPPGPPSSQPRMITHPCSALQPLRDHPQPLGHQQDGGRLVWRLGSGAGCRAGVCT